MAFDGIVTKAISQELQNLSGARIDKVYQPNKNEIIIGLYTNGCNYALNICIDSQNGRIHLTTHAKQNPKIAPNFCMLLRKNIIGLRLKNVITSDLERVITIELEGFDDVDDIISKKIIIELMGKHGNIILLDENKVIIDSLRHISNQNESYRNIYPHEKYIYPTSTKYNFLEVSNYEEFKKKLDLTNSYEDLPKEISNKFNGISKSFVCSILNNLQISKVTEKSLERIYNYITNIINNIGTDNLDFQNIINQDGKIKDYSLILKNNNTPYNLNFFIDDFYYNKETSEEFKNYRNTVLKIILNALKKYNSRLINIDKKLDECKNMDIYKLYGELITSNLYKIKQNNSESITLENYYDNNNLIKIPLDKKYLPSINAQKYFKKYNKLKNTLEIVSKQKQDTQKELDYLESIVYELENSKTTNDIADIFEEISENVLFNDMIGKTKSNKFSKYENSKSCKNYKKGSLTKNKNVSFNPIKYTIEGFTVLVGRNNKENDYLTLKYASKQDIWFHTKDIHGSHVILKTSPMKNINSVDDINNDILIKCAILAAKHSKAKQSYNVPVDYCLVKYVKKPANSKPGMVIYSNNKTIYAKLDI